MATTKKSTTKKAAAPKAAATKKAATKKVVKTKPLNDPMLVSLNSPQQKSVEQIQKNQERIEKAAGSMILVAADSGARLVKLKDEVQKKFGRVWKVWAQTVGNLPVGYEQASRYMKLAKNPKLLAEINANSIEDAVKQIEHKLKPEKQEAADKQKSEKREQSKVTGGEISEKVMQEIEQCTNVKDLRQLITLINQRIEELQDGTADDVAPASEDDLEVPYEEVDDTIADDIKDAIS